MKFSTLTCIAAVSATAVLGGCVVAPVAVRPAVYPAYGGPVVYEAPPGVVYIAPSYAIPGPGYAWQYHGRYGWGWRHSGLGWHRGWR